MPLIWLISPLLVGSAYSREPLIKTNYFYATEGESLRELLETRIGIPKATLDQQNYYNKIRAWNPGILDPSNLSQGQRVYVEIPYNTQLSPAPIIIKDPNIELAQVKSKKELNFVENIEREKRKNLSIFYTLSSGTFREEVPGSNVVTTSNQDSPLTLGVSYNQTLPKNLSLSTSAYLAKLDSGTTSSDKEIEIPWEYGLTAYVGYKKNFWPVEVYTGLDYESFSSFNTEELVTDEDLAVRTHNIAYATLGVSKAYTLLNRFFLTKFSMSRSFSSTESRESSVDPKPYTGSKFILFTAMKAAKRWYYSAFYKQHNLEGPTSLNIRRIGIGVGYNF